MFGPADLIAFINNNVEAELSHETSVQVIHDFDGDKDGTIDLGEFE